MKKILSVAAFIILACICAHAVPPPAEPYRYTQPDGSVIWLVNHGDEFHNWITRDGKVVEADEAGFMRPVDNPQSRIRPSAASVSRREQARQLSSVARQKNIGMGEKHFLVLLIEFSDLYFTLSYPQQEFYNLLNQEGYSDNGGTGSVKDFYTDQSLGKFKPTFDVYGPVRLSRSYTYYGKQSGSTSDLYPDEALYDACKLLDSQIDFSEYDHDHDGYVDNVFFYFAGHNQAEGGGANTIWPHAWSLHRYNGNFDGVRVWSYACASEYRGSSGNNMAGIGTFTHEFAHVIGLPDFYDTDYEENGSCEAVSAFSTMCAGCYLNSGRTPCNFTAQERNLLDWMGEPTSIDTPGKLTIGPVSENIAYTFPADVEGESFILECRNATGWDAYLPGGLVIYHKDKSKNICHDNITAASMWMYYDQELNCYADHPCFYLVPSVDYSSLTRMVYPCGFKTYFTPVPWSGEVLPHSLSNISYYNGVVTTDVAIEVTRTIKGTVKDTNKAVLSGVSVVAKGDQGVSYGASTDNSGNYKIVIVGDEQKDFLVVASKLGYITASENITLNSLTEEVNFVLKEGGNQPLAEMGYNSIYNPHPGDDFAVGELLELKVITSPYNKPSSTKWYMDDKILFNNHQTLTAGKHTVKAVLTYDNGTTEDLFLEINVK